MDKSYMFMFQFDLLTMKTELLSQIKLECKCTLLMFGNDRNKKFLECVPKLSLIYIIYGSFSLLSLADILVRLYGPSLYGA